MSPGAFADRNRGHAKRVAAAAAALGAYPGGSAPLAAIGHGRIASLLDVPPPAAQREVPRA